MYNLVREFTEALVLAVVLFLALQISFQNYRVEGTSMAPTIGSGEYLAVNKLAYLEFDVGRLARLIPFWDAEGEKKKFVFSDGPERGDIVVFTRLEGSERNYVKRVIGLPGEDVSIYRGIVYINGKYLEESYTRVYLESETRKYGILGDGEYFVMGDNRPFSNDSRMWGVVLLDDIVGNRLFSYDLPFEIGFVDWTAE